MPDITDLAHDRGEDGELLPVTEEIEIHGDEYEIDVYPATTGQKNEWRDRLKDEGEELADEILYDLLDEFADLEPSDFGAETWEGVRPAVTDALSEAILARLFDAEDPDEFAQALQEAAAQAAASGNAETGTEETG